MQQLPQIPERLATTEIAAIYNDIRRVTRTPLVNLIYRHLATMPGALPWVWSLIRPPLLAGVIEAAADRVVAATDLPVLPPFSPQELQSAGLEGAHGESGQMARRVLWAYNRGNRLNMVSLSAVWLLLDHGASDVPRPAPHPTPAVVALSDEPLPAIPPIQTLDTLDPATASRLADIAALHGGGGVLPSLYLHLANWPGFLALAYERLAPLLRDGVVRTSGEETCVHVESEARGIVPLLTTDVPAPHDQLAAIRTVLGQFAHHLIPEMIPVGVSLARAMPATPHA